MTTVKRLCTVGILAPLAVAAVAAQHRPFMSAEHAGSKATVIILGEDVTLRVESKAGVRTASIGKGWKRVVNVRFSQDASRIAIVAEAASAMVVVVDAAVPSVLVSNEIAEAVIAPDARAVIVEHSGRDAGGSRIGIIPVGGLADLGTPLSLGGRADTMNPVRASAFHWTDPEVVAFLVHGDTAARVVAAQVDQTGKIQRIEVKTLPVAELVDTGKAAGTAAVKVLAGASITRLPTSGLTLRLQFAASPALRVPQTDVTMW